LGEPIDEFIAELQRAMDDLRNWKPVRYNSLRGGMIFEPTELIKDDVVEKDDDEKDEKFLELEYFLESCWAKSKGVSIKDVELLLTLYPSEFKIKNDK